MTKTFTLTIDGDPMPQRRGAPCVSRLGKRYIQDDKECSAEKVRVSRIVRDKIEAIGGFEPFGGAIVAHINFYFDKPAYKIRKNSTPYPFVDCKPDFDNLVKLTLDGIQRANGAKKVKDKKTVVWLDDGQVLGGVCLKSWCEDGMEPHTEVELIEVTDHDRYVMYKSKLLSALGELL